MYLEENVSEFLILQQMWWEQNMTSHYDLLSYSAQNPLQREWGNFPFANWNGIIWGLRLEHLLFIKICFLPHFESFIWERKFEKRFIKEYPIHSPNGVLPICKLPFPNGSYRNGVCRGLWAIPHWKSLSKLRQLSCSSTLKKCQFTL